MALQHCSACDFDFFDVDPTAQLAAGKLDESRLRAAGLAIPDVDKDFANGLRQSQPYVEAYLGEAVRNRNVLEIGCSWGYFLQLVRERGGVPHGLEVNGLRADYVQDKLGIPCHTDLGECERQGRQYHQIFLFYVLEYIPDPVNYLRRLLGLLDADGRIVLITPNLSDALMDLWRNEAFGNFFYDEHAVNYFTTQSVRKLVAKLPASKSAVSTHQGYSVINHLSWYLTNAPRTTGMVGGDYYVGDVTARLKEHGGQLGAELAAALCDFDARYRSLIEAHDYGNQIEVTISR
jgi:2-polyprenyl-3-methyl-5-hydroxy-6-metoxy-1,4-benzoquinol methylase